MKLRHILFFLGLFPLTLAAQPGIMMQPQPQQQLQPQPQRRTTVVDEQIQKLLIAGTAISSLYVEDVDQSKLVESAIKGNQYKIQIINYICKSKLRLS